MRTDGFGTSYVNEAAAYVYDEDRTGDLTDGQWYYLCSVQDGVGTANMFLYRNGTLSASVAGGSGHLRCSLLLSFAGAHGSAIAKSAPRDAAG